jgi:heterodisulfide reductase subunit C
VTLFKVLYKRKIHLKGLVSILLILLLILSGFLLEAVKIISEPVFMEMVEEYSNLEDDTDLEDLKIYWEKHYNVVFDDTLIITKEKLALGKDLNEEYCIACHSPVKSAFMSNSISRALKKTSVWLNRYRADNFVYYIHYFLSLLILVTLPFSRLFHIFLIPFASLEKNFKKELLSLKKGYINTATLYACTNCGFCSDVCSVLPNYLVTKNIHTLPHSKIEAFKQLMHHSPFEPAALFLLQSGNEDCTCCHKCTDICPSGIDLQNLWVVLEQKLALKGFQNNYTYIDSKSLKEWTGLAPEKEKIPSSRKVTTNLADNVDSFENCIQCTICSNVCPSVEYDLVGNDFTPHQVLNLLRLGNKHLAAGTCMVWNCLTCFSCQENCPQGIRVADIMLELRNNGNLRADAMKIENFTNKKAD